MYPFYLGIDLHLRRTYVVLMDGDGHILAERRLPNSEMQAFIVQEVPQHTYSVLEATRNWPFMYDLLKRHVARVELAHPKELKAISTAAVKADRINARTLANLARMNYLPIPYAAPMEARNLRLYVRHRATLVRQRTQAKSRIHVVLARYNLTSPVANLNGVKGRTWVNEVCEQLVRPAARQVIEEYMALINELNRYFDALERNMEMTPDQAEIVKLIKTIPGAGQVIATTIVAEIGDIHRFAFSKALCNWAGRTPRIRSSDQFSRYGRISKQGSPYLRSAMTRAATVASRVSKRWYAVREQLLPRCGNEAAKVAVARQLLVVAYCMWKRGQPYQEDYEQHRKKAGELDLGQGALTPRR